MKKYTYLVNFDSQALERVGESFAVKGDGGIAELEFIIPSDFGIPPTQAVWRAYYKLPGERESLFETLPTVEQTESGDYMTGWVVTKALTQTSGRLGFSLAAISGNNIQWNSRTVIIQVQESQYQPESEEAEKPYTGRLDALEGSMATIRGEFAEVQDDFEELKETATLGTPIPESLVANMTKGRVYIYTGAEPGYTAGHVYYYVGGTLTDGGVYGGTTVDATLTQSGQAADAKKTGDEISAIKEDLSALQSDVSSHETVDLSTETGKAGIVSGSSGNWVDRATDFTYFIPVGEYDEKVTITANAERPAILCILRSDSVTHNSPPPYATGCGRESIPAGTTKTFAIPSDAKFLAVAKIIMGNNNEPASVVVTSRKFATISEAKSITNTLPASKGVENVIRRCRQFTDIKWTPAVDIPRISKMMGISGSNSDYFEDVFKAGKEYKGIPYGQANKNAALWGKDATIGFKVGWTVGLDAFVTAIENPESVVAKESEYTADGGVHRACFYAAICTSLCGYAYDLARYYTTTDIVNAPGMTRRGLMSNIDVNTIELGNMLWTTKHGAIITDLIKDDGQVTGIEISEETSLGNDNWNVLGEQYGGICRRQVWSVEDFHTRWDSYGLYRYTNIDSVTYTASPYVDTGNEGTGHRIFAFPVLPYMGENFEYVSGKIPSTKILTPAYKANSLNKLRVLKNGQAWNTDGTTNYYDVSGAYVEVGFADVGTYEAYLCQVVDGSEVMTTRPCHWTVSA